MMYMDTLPTAWMAPPPQPCVEPTNEVCAVDAVVRMTGCWLQPVCAMPPMAGATEHTVHTDVLVAHAALEKEPVGHVPEHAAVVSPAVAP
jgi:hypothetical protein